MTRWLRLAGELYWFWVVSEHWSEGRSWLEEALTRGDGAQPATLVGIVQAAGGFAYRQGDYERAGQLAEQAFELSKTLKDKQGIIRARIVLGNVALEQDPVHARALHEEEVTLARELGDKWWIGYSLVQLADTVRALGDYGRAAAFYTESLALCGQRNRWVSFQCLEGLGCVASAQGHYERAAVLFGAAEPLQESLRSRRDPDYLAEVAQARGSLGDGAFLAAWAEGRAMTLEQAVEYALEAPGEAT